ncbi:MAG: collagen-like protein, partial [Bdellovibrionales bacterium]|nr:collagen-like protein [Bdellovibrionales bacterium]
LALTPDQSFAAKKQALCLTSEGKLIVKRKCKTNKGESTLDAEGLGNLVDVNSVPGPSGDQGPKGDEGSQGPQGDEGPAGQDGSFDISPVLASHNPTINPGTHYVAFGGFCPNGKYSVAGSCVAPQNSALTLVSHGVNSPQLSDHFSYTCIWRNDTGAPVQEALTVKFFCLSIP